MEFSTSQCVAKSNILPLLSPPTSTTKHALIRMPRKSGGEWKMRCGGRQNESSLVVEVERELEEIEREGREWKEMQNCRDRAMGVELLECLEREAIMGDDEGRAPNDYDRRARIFDKSSKVFQALKQLHDNTQTRP